MIRTRDVLRWHFSVCDMAYLVVVALGGLTLGILDRVAIVLERCMEHE